MQIIVVRENKIAVTLIEHINILPDQMYFAKDSNAKRGIRFDLRTIQHLNHYYYFFCSHYSSILMW